MSISGWRTDCFHTHPIGGNLSSSDHTMFFHTMISYHVFPAIFSSERIFQSIWNSTKFPICIQNLIESISHFKHHSFYV